MKTYSNFDLTNYNSYRIKAICRTAYFPESDQDIINIFSDKSKKLILIGGGYNILLSKEYYDQEFVIFSGNYDNMQIIGDDQLLCEAGCDMKTLSEFALEEGLTGLEIYYDIPSSLGGAVVMNAGAGGEDIKGLLIKVWYFNPHTQQITEITTDEINFEYRNSFFQKNPDMVVCKALLQLRPAIKSKIKQKMDDIKTARWAKQPREYPNAGSVFKRPPGKFVGPMIDELGLKGFTIGGAKVSEKHSGFIINTDSAKGTDIMYIIDHVKSEIKNKFEIDLEVEQRVI